MASSYDGSNVLPGLASGSGAFNRFKGESMTQCLQWKPGSYHVVVHKAGLGRTSSHERFATGLCSGLRII